MYIGVNVSTLFKTNYVRINDLLLDPLNPRFGIKEKKVPVTDFKDKSIQEDVLVRIQSYQLEGLIQSIKANGFSPLDRIAVVRLEEGSSKYVVIEGNRRIAAVKKILQDTKLSDELRSSLELLEVCVLTNKVYSTSESERAMIQGLRHLSGFEEWGDYQKGWFLYEHMTQHGGTIATVGKMVGLGSKRSKWCYDSVKQLELLKKEQIYQECERHGCAEDDYFLFFYQVMKSPVLRDKWFKMNKGPIGDIEEVKKFCLWIGLLNHLDPFERQIRKPEYVKDLIKIFESEEAVRKLESGARIEEALLVCIKDTKINSELEMKLKEFIFLLKDLQANEVKILSEDEKNDLKSILEQVKKILKK